MAKIVTFGELLLRLNTPHRQRFTQIKYLEATFAGAEANVAVACAQFGHQPYFVSALPAHPMADAALQQLASWKVDASRVLRQGKRMGVYYLEEGFGVRPSAVIYDREGSSFAQTSLEKYDWKEILQGAEWLHLTGITPALSADLKKGIPALAAQARGFGVKVAFDLNYRAKLWDVADARKVLEETVAVSDLCLGSIHQVQPVLGIEVGKKTSDDALKAAEVMCQRLGAAGVVLTSRETLPDGKERRWAAGQWDGKSAVSVPLDYQILDPLGGGDAFSGGVLSSLMDGMDLKASLDFGVAAAAWKYSHQGDYLQASRSEVAGLLGPRGSAGVLR